MNNIKFYSNGNLVKEIDNAAGYQVSSSGIALVFLDGHSEFITINTYDHVVFTPIPEEFAEGDETGESNVVSLVPKN